MINIICSCDKTSRVLWAKLIISTEGTPGKSLNFMLETALLCLHKMYNVILDFHKYIIFYYNPNGLDLDNLYVYVYDLLLYIDYISYIYALI